MKYLPRYVQSFKTSELGRIKSLLPPRKMIMRLLALLGKILSEIRRQMRVHLDEELLNDKQLDMLDTITKIYRQQKDHFNSGDSRESIPNRIVSVSKPYTP